MDHLCFLSKNLYNATLYAVRQHYFRTNEYLNYYEVNRQFTHQNQSDYRSLPAKVSKMIQRQVDQNFRSFFGLLKKKRNGSYNKPVKIPSYLDPVKGRQAVHYERGALSFRKEGYIKLSQTNIMIRTKIDRQFIKYVKIVHSGHHIDAIVGYEHHVPERLGDNQRYAAIDIGVNNLCTVSSNVIRPFIINGLPVKSMNHYYNRQLSIQRSHMKTRHNRYSSRRIQNLHLRRGNKVDDYLHKASRYIVNQLVEADIRTLVIGYNKGWKQDMKLSKEVNQKFVQIPFLRLIHMLEYKCAEYGIEVVRHEESYTSRCSFFDDEDIRRHETYKGKRQKRGLFITSDGTKVNADLNGSLNIMKKYLLRYGAWNRKLFLDCVKVCSTPSLQKISL